MNPTTRTQCPTLLGKVARVLYVPHYMMHYGLWLLSCRQMDWISRLVRHTWGTGDLFYPQALSRLIRHAWDTVDLFYPHAIIVTSYDMPGIQWTYSIPRPLVPHTTCLGYSGPILSPGPESPHTTCLGYSGPILSPCHYSRLIVCGPSYWDTCLPWASYAWDTVDLFYPRALSPSYNMPGIQWTYSIPRPLVPHTTCLGYSGPILSPGP